MSYKLTKLDIAALQVRVPVERGKLMLCDEHEPRNGQSHCRSLHVAGSCGLRVPEASRLLNRAT